MAEYHEAMGIINKDKATVYKYQIEEYVETTSTAKAACQT